MMLCTSGYTVGAQIMRHSNKIELQQCIDLYHDSASSDTQIDTSFDVSLHHMIVMQGVFTHGEDCEKDGKCPGQLKEQNVRCSPTLVIQGSDDHCCMSPVHR